MSFKLRPEVAEFAAVMEIKLRKHDAERGDDWRVKQPEWLLARMDDEIQELTYGGGPVEHWDRKEAVDAANFLMFLWHVMGQGGDNDS